MFYIGDLDAKEIEITTSSSTGKDASYLLICNLETNQWDSIDLANIALSMDRSMDELAILLKSGDIVIFSTQNGKLILKETWKIKDFSMYKKENSENFLTRLTKTFIIFKSQFSIKEMGKNLQTIRGYLLNFHEYDYNMSLLYSKKGHQAILLDYQNVRYSFLSPNLKKEYTVIPLLDKDIEGVIKIHYREEERLVLVKDDNLDPWTKIFNMYLFKDYNSALKILLDGK